MNWSLVLNALLLISVLAILFRILKKKAPLVFAEERRPSLNPQKGFGDDIISVRKVNAMEFVEDAAEISSPPLQKPFLHQEIESELEPEFIEFASLPQEEPEEQAHQPIEREALQTLMIFLLAKPHRQLAGYEMLQTLLAAGLRFGEGQLFHYHQSKNGQGPILCSVAAATASGTFDLPNIGAFNGKGLCVFMHLSGNTGVDTERLDKMIEVSQQLAEELDTFLLDDHRKPFTNETKMRYCQQL